jgi:hypothetical protein
MKIFKRVTYKQITMIWIVLILMALACFMQCGSGKVAGKQKVDTVKYNQKLFVGTQPRKAKFR